MSQHYPPNVEKLIRDRMATGRYNSEEQLLVEALQSLEENDQELKALEEGLASMDQGEEGTLLNEAFDRLRAKHQIQG
jgi:Arc/MetJ-type ribon-helix-helix transcriptional regulator